MVRTRVPLKVIALLKFLPESEGGRAAFPDGSVYTTLVRFNGEASPSKSMRCEFETPVDVNGNVKAKISLVADDVSPLVLDKGKLFDLVEGVRTVAEGKVISPAIVEQPAPFFVFGTANIPRN